jgi:hypothetical protein
MTTPEEGAANGAPNGHINGSDHTPVFLWQLARAFRPDVDRQAPPEDPTADLYEGSERRLDVQRFFTGPRALSATAAMEIMDATAGSEPIADPNIMGVVYRNFATIGRGNTFESVIALGASSRHMAALYGSEIGMGGGGGMRLHEYAQAALNRFDDEYYARFSAKENGSLRMALAVRNIARPVAVTLHKSPVGGGEDQALLASAVLAHVPGLTVDDRLFINNMIRQDYIGLAVRRMIPLEGARAALESLRQSLPPERRARFYEYVEALYMSDATAYTSDAPYRDGNGFLQHSQPTLDHVFTRDAAGRLAFRNDDRQEVYERLLGRR